MGCMPPLIAPPPCTIPFHNPMCDQVAAPLGVPGEGRRVCLAHPLHVRQVVQQSDGVLRVGLVVLAGPRPDPQRPGGHGLQHGLVQVLGDQGVRQLSQVVLQDP